jgi:putative flippase GtrA
MLSKKIPEYRRFLKFSLVGLSGVFVNNFALWFFVEFTVLPFYLCSFIAIELAIINNFLLNDIWTWSDKNPDSKLIRLLKYNVSTAFSSLFINITVLMFFKEWVGSPYLVSNLIGIGVGVLFNFWINHNWTFGDFRINIPRSIWIIFSLSLLWRLFLASNLGAGFDEAYYYSYSIRPSLSYFDHPPMVGFIAGFFPFLTGITNSFTIRLGAIILFSFSGLLVYRLAKIISGEKEAYWTHLLFNITPLFMLAGGMMILPDAGLICFWVLTLTVLYRMFTNETFENKYWILAGAFTGLALLSKYHGILLIIGVFLYVIIMHPRELLKKGIWIYTIICLLVFLPVIIWNFQNDFISITFQSGRAIGEDFSFTKFYQALGGQAAYLTPFIFLPIVYVIIKTIRNSFKVKDINILFFCLFGILPILFILCVSFFKQILPHWTLPGYLILMIPFGSWLKQAYHKKFIARFFSWFTAVFIIVSLLIILIHSNYGILRFDKMAENGWMSKRDAEMDPTLDTYSWDELGNYILTEYKTDSLFLFSNRWLISGQIDLAVAGKFAVMCFNKSDARGFGIWDDKLNMLGKDGLFICTNRYNADPVKEYSDYFSTIEMNDSLVVYRGSLPAKTFYFYLCKNLHKKYPTYFSN